MVVKFLTKLVGCAKKKSTLYEIFRFFRFLIKFFFYYVSEVKVVHKFKQLSFLINLATLVSFMFVIPVYAVFDIKKTKPLTYFDAQR